MYQEGGTTLHVFHNKGETKQKNKNWWTITVKIIHEEADGDSAW